MREPLVVIVGNLNELEPLFSLRGWRLAFLLRELNGPEPRGVTVSANLKRNSLTVGQRAMDYALNLSPSRRTVDVGTKKKERKKLPVVPPGDCRARSSTYRLQRYRSRYPVCGRKAIPKCLAGFGSQRIISHL